MKYITYGLSYGLMGFCFSAFLAVFIWAAPITFLCLIFLDFNTWIEQNPYRIFMDWWTDSPIFMMLITFVTTTYGIVAGLGRALVEYEEDNK